jgi:molybdopterin synthase catalytic subunit
MDSFLKKILTIKNPKVGAIGFFLGVVRGTTKSENKVKKLEIEAYKEIAEDAFNNISEEVIRNFGVTDVHINHIIGELDVGDLIVAVAVTGASRSQVFPALETVVKRMKSEATIWKKEHLDKGEAYWIHDK